MTTQELSTDKRTDIVRHQTPRVEVSETKAAIVLVADMPGVGTDGVAVALDEGVLTIEGTAERGANQAPRSYRRRFTLNDPGLFDLDSIQAKMANGVLELTLPKAAKPEARQIQITAA